MTCCVIEAGPVVVRGPNHVDLELVSSAIDGIDDELTLVGESPVRVDNVWRRIIRDAAGGSRDAITVVCPTWWSQSRVARVRDAARTVANDVVLLRRSEVPRNGGLTLVEVAPELVVLSSPRAGVEVLTRNDFDARLSAICTSSTVLLDVPEGVEIGDTAAAVADRDWVRYAVTTPSQSAPPPTPRRGGAVVAVAAGTLLSVAGVCGGLVANHVRSAAPDDATTLLVEGRVGVVVPARWSVQRVTSGPGSDRVQVVSRDDADVAIHVTQSLLAQPQSLEQVAATLRAALDQEPEGVFVGINPSDNHADRAVVTYRETRPGHFIRWFVLTDGMLRIAIGCQSAQGREEAVRVACDAAIGSAHAVR